MKSFYSWYTIDHKGRLTPYLCWGDIHHKEHGTKQGALDALDNWVTDVVLIESWSKIPTDED
jgi:hypothetical protein